LPRRLSQEIDERIRMDEEIAERVRRAIGRGESGSELW
jgi:hypothetical protein